MLSNQRGKIHFASEQIDLLCFQRKREVIEMDHNAMIILDEWKED